MPHRQNACRLSDLVEDLEKEEDYVAMVGVELYGSKAFSNK